MNRDLSAATTPATDAVTGLAEAAQRALADQPTWTPHDSACTIRAELLPLWPEVTPAAVRDMLCRAASLAVANGVTGLPETIASWAPDAMLSAELRTQNPEPCPGILSPAELASMIAFDEASDAKTLDDLAVLLALAYTPGASRWTPR